MIATQMGLHSIANMTQNEYKARAIPVRIQFPVRIPSTDSQDYQWALVMAYYNKRAGVNAVASTYAVFNPSESPIEDPKSVKFEHIFKVCEGLHPLTNQHTTSARTNAAPSHGVTDVVRQIPIYST